MDPNESSRMVLERVGFEGKRRGYRGTAGVGGRGKEDGAEFRVQRVGIAALSFALVFLALRMRRRPSGASIHLPLGGRGDHGSGGGDLAANAPDAIRKP